MKPLITATAAQAKSYFLKGSSYFNGDFPTYISFEPILSDVASILGGDNYTKFQVAKKSPALFPDVNYSFVANKDGRFAWRPYELMHPAIYVSLVNLICSEENWSTITNRLIEFEDTKVVCCSRPGMPTDKNNSNKATQVRHWWQAVEQQSLVYSLEYSHLLHTDVTDCYGSLYTHSISWALHGLEIAKASKGKKALLGDEIDSHIQAGRYGQTNGISQGSVLMDFIAEIVLSYVDGLISDQLSDSKNVKILRYRDDYRIFANSDSDAEYVLKIVSDQLRAVGMRLGVAKTFLTTNVIEGSIKPDKLAGIDLQWLGKTSTRTLQKQLLSLHSFGRRFPNSGALRRLMSELHSKLIKKKAELNDLAVLVAICTDIAVVSPLTFPVVAGILSHLISVAPQAQKHELWNKVHQRMLRVPYNGYLQIWLQRVTKPKSVGIQFDSDEPICQIVNGNEATLWNSDWIAYKKLKSALKGKKIVIERTDEIPEVIQASEVELFSKNAFAY